MSTPRAVKLQAAEADRLLKELNAKPGETVIQDAPAADPAASTQAPAPDAAAPAAPAAPAASTPTEPAAPAPVVDDFKQKYLVLKGKYDKEIPELKVAMAERDDRIRNLEQMLEQLANRVPPASDSAPSGRSGSQATAPKLIKPEEEEEYGKEFFDVVGRRAREIVEAEMAEIRAQRAAEKQQNSRLNEEQRKHAVFSALHDQVPNWEAINASQDFLAWLANPDVFSKRTKRELLTEAFQEGDAARVVQFFKAFQEDSAHAPAPAARTPSVDAGTLVAPGTPRGGAPAEAPGGARVWTQAEIGEFYAAVRRGRVGPDQKRAVEAEIIRAAAEGRVR